MKKTKIILAVVAFVLATVMLSSCGKEISDVPVGMTEIESEFSDVRLFVPHGWTADISTGFLSAHVQDGSNISLQIMSVNGVYSSSENDYIINVGSATYNGITEYFEKEYLPLLNSTFADITLKEQYSQGQTLGSEKRACKYVFSVTVSGQEYEVMQIIAVHGTNIFVFSYTAKTSLYETYLEDVEEITSNIIFK